MASDIEEFRLRLRRTTGYSESAIRAAWPEWWSEAAEGSPSAKAELRFSVARKLGLDPRSLLDDEGPRFMWDDSAKYKHFTGDEDHERPAITAFGTSVSRILLKGSTSTTSLVGASATEIRNSILQTRPFVGLTDLVSLLWAVGIPIIHLRVHPLSAKHMAAMAVSFGERQTILLAKDAQYPASIAFHVAHEIGHISLGHIDLNSAVVDMEDPAEHAQEADEEEQASDRFALELLTGDPDFKVQKIGNGRNPNELAQRAMIAGEEYRIEPGTLALCYGYVTGEWSTVQNALALIYDQPSPVWEFINRTASTQLDWEAMGDENASFIHAVMGGV